jgi:two-component system sensor histidine kinase ChiS
LAELIGAIKAIRFDNLEQVTARIRSKGNDEFKLIEKTLNEMIRKLNGARHKLEENAAELKEKNEKLEQTDRLKDEFLANTSHELRTPLHGIIGIAQTLSMNLEQQSTGTIQSNLDIIVSTGRHLSMLVDDILDFSKLKHNSLNLVLQAVDLYQVVTVVEKLSQPLLTLKGLQFENRLPLYLPYVSADEVRLQQILQNLIGNAIKFSEQGVITIEARQQGGWLEIAVSDSAQLIPPDKFGIIFQAFEQLDGSLSRVHGGTGLGLSIVKQLVELHHGIVWVSNHSNGNTFTFTLPVAMGTETTHISPPPIDSAEPIRLPCTLVTGTASQDNALFTILAVDDDIANLQVIINQLSSENYAVHCVQEGQAALDWISHHGRPDLVLLDIMMPRMSGFEVCKQLRQQFDIGSLPIVFLTASHRRKDRETGFSLGANDYLTKPFEKSDLLARVRVHIRLLLAKKQIQTMRNCANRIAEFKNHEQMLIFATDQMASTRLVSEGVVFKETTILRAPEKKYDFLSQLPDLSILQPYLSETDEQIIIINSIKPEEPIQRYFIQQCGIDLQRAHLAYLQPNGSRENTICLFRTNDRMPFSELDREYMLNMLDQLQIIENNIQTMLSDELVAVLPEIQPNLARITHITAASPYCSVFLENEPIAREVRITLSSLDLYFSDELLLRIHRSHLINPHKLIGIQKRLVGNRKYKYDAVVGYKDRLFSLRIGDNYLTKMKRYFSHFFPTE